MLYSIVLCIRNIVGDLRVRYFYLTLEALDLYEQTMLLSALLLSFNRNIKIFRPERNIKFCKSSLL
jgi:hypothetical protein